MQCVSVSLQQQFHCLNLWQAFAAYHELHSGMICLLLLLLQKQYSLLWILAFNTVFLHSQRSLTIACLNPKHLYSCEIKFDFFFFSLSLFLMGLGCQPNAQALT
jgi:hypothetical protein